MGGLVYGDRVWVVKTSARGVTSVLEREREDARKEAQRPAQLGLLQTSCPNYSSVLGKRTGKQFGHILVTLKTVEPASVS